MLRSCFRDHQSLDHANSDSDLSELAFLDARASSPSAGDDVRAVVVACRRMIFGCQNIKPGVANLPAQIRRAEDACKRRQTDRAHRRQSKPKQRVHVSDARCFGNEHAIGREQAMDVAQRAGEITDEMQIIESQNRIERRFVRELICGRGPEGQRSDGTRGELLVGDCDHASGQIGPEIVLHLACDPKRRRSCPATQLQHAVAGLKQVAGSIERALVTALIGNHAPGVLS